MSLFRLRGISALLSTLILTATSALAQTSSTDNAGATARCGFHRVKDVDLDQVLRNTALRDPELYRTMTADAKERDHRSLSAADVAETTFWVVDFVTMQFTQVRATRLFDGRLARIWVDNRDTARIKAGSATIRNIAKALDTATPSRSRNPKLGIISNDEEVFGSIPQTHAVEGKSDFLLMNLSEQGLAGFYLPHDQTTQHGSNRRNLLYIDSEEGITRLEGLLNTIAHEFQHLIHQHHHPEGDTFFDEGCSEVAGLMCGYVDRWNTDYLTNTNVDLLSWSESMAGGDYERAYTLFHYLREQFGDRFLKEFVKAPSNGLHRIDEALAAMGIATQTMNWMTILKNFAVANYTQSNTNPIYNYKVKITRGQSRAKIDSSYAGAALPKSGIATLKRYGIAYLEFADPGVMTFKLTAQNQARGMVIGYKGSEITVTELQSGQEYTLQDDAGAYDRIVVALVGLSNSQQAVAWSAKRVVVTSGIDADAAVAGGLSLTAPTPNPTSGNVTIGFTLPTQGTARVQLVNARGEILREIEREEAGAQSVRLACDGLPNGYYIVRLTQNGRSAARPLVIAH